MSRIDRAGEETAEARKWPFLHLRVSALGLLLLLAAHGAVLHRVFAHAALPAAVAGGVIIVAVAMHAGLAGALSAALRPRSRDGRKNDG